MSLVKTHIFRIVKEALLCGLLLTAACSSDSDTPVSVEEEQAGTTMGIYIKVGNSASGTESRAAIPPSDGNYDPGTAYENYIDLSSETPDLRIYLFTTDNKLISELHKPKLDVVASNPAYRTYELTFRVDTIFPDPYSKPSFKVVMLANWRTYPEKESLTPGETTIDQLVKSAEAVAEYIPTGATLTRDQRIPMFGVNEYTDVTFYNDKPVVHSDPLYLLRAYAKIEIYDAEGTISPIKSVKLTGYNTYAYKAPLGVTHQSQYVKFGPENDYVVIPSIPDNSTTGQSISIEGFSTTANGAGKHFVIYVPEYKNVGIDEKKRSHIDVTYADGNTFTINFKHYQIPSADIQEASPFDILRNYWYKFSVKRNESSLSWIADIQPYAEVKLDPFFGLDRDADGNIILKWHDDGTYDVVVDHEKVTKDKDGDLVIHRFADGSLLCKEVVLKDYIHDDSHEKDYEYVFEKDSSGGNMVILRQESTGGQLHGEEVPVHEHGLNDRPLFVLDKKGAYHYVEYSESVDGKPGKPTLSPVDTRGDTIVQANGFQFRNVDDMKKYMGTYVVKINIGTEADPEFIEELRYYKTAETLDWDTGTDGMTDAGTRSLGKSFGRKAIINRLKETGSHVPYKYNTQQIQIKK